MKNIRKFLKESLNKATEDIHFFDARGDEASVNLYEKQAWDLKKQLAVLDMIEYKREGNLLRFNEDGSFNMWAIRTSAGGDQTVEYYDAQMRFDNCFILTQEASCTDVTDSFDIDLVLSRVVVTNDLIGCGINTNNYYFVSDDTLWEACQFYLQNFDKPEAIENEKDQPFQEADYNFETADGAIGTLADVTNESWYKNPPMTLYDELEYDCWNLLCDYAELLGLHLDRDEIDFNLAKGVQENIMETLEELVGIKFPVYKERSSLEERISNAEDRKNNSELTNDSNFKNMEDR